MKRKTLKYAFNWSCFLPQKKQKLYEYLIIKAIERIKKNRDFSKAYVFF
ncbi:hypothetical protein SAMN05443633_108110 [Chryseobacterium arachidis]|uniref:Uncharacterized protein n=1 Tax=Chryseobacterium arachidis TaxID=1416778 RepID=A0A1M5FRP1_9FLAO|nr:hypothetical protein SAMN05443633_108110 [Chryseobacterium arachidis]